LSQQNKVCYAGAKTPWFRQRNFEKNAMNYTWLNSKKSRIGGNKKREIGREKKPWS
jgi:hypothetical protein